MSGKPLVYEFNGVRVDLRAFQAFRGEVPLSMEPKAFEVLVFMIENRGGLIEKQAILDRVWPDTSVTENAMTRVIAQLRRVLGDDAKEARYIETVPRKGYRFIAKVDEIGDPEGESTAKAPGALNVMSITGRTATTFVNQNSVWAGKRAVLAAVAFTVAIGLVAVALIWRSQARTMGSVRPAIIRTVQITNSSELDIFPSFSPDGSSIAFSSNRSGGFEIYIRQLAGGRDQQITSDGMENLEPAWSSDGSQIAYYSGRRRGICVVPALGGVPRQLTDFGSHPAWSPDGKLIAFQSGAIRDLTANASAAGPPSTLWVVAAAGGAPNQLTMAGVPAGGHGSPSWSPDGSRIVFTSSDFSDSDVWSVAAAGGQLQSITVARLRCYEPVYSRDARSIYYSTEGAGLLQQAVSKTTGAPEGEPIQVINPGTTGIRHLALSANGKRMLYSAVSVQSNVWSLPLSPASGGPTGNPRPLTQNSNYRNTSPVFSPDGQKIAFNTWRRAAMPEIWLMDQDGGNQVQLMADTPNHNLVGWFQDVDHLAFAGVQGGRWGVQGLALGAGRETQLVELPPNAGFFVRIAPDGHAIAYHSVGGGAMNIWTQDVPSGKMRQLTFDDQSMAFPCWSPDSKFIALQMTRGDDTNICVVPSDGGTPIQVTHDRGLSWAYSWSPDGDKIAFAGTREGIWNVYWVSRRTGDERQITANFKTNAYVRYPAWSPLGDQIVYEYAETTGNIWMAEFR
jgi:Tol biopolymer transport system component/DNA-binding winged helix-turn-helix (wHTH) protein